jgi:hypothetical protein
MLLKHRPPKIESRPVDLREGLEHLEQKSMAVLRWLNANKVDYVVVGPVARAVHGDVDTRGPVAIVPAPYGRNYARLCTALVAAHAGLRAEGAGRGTASRPEQVAVKLTHEKLARGHRWMLRFAGYDLDIEGHGSGGHAASDTGSSDTGSGVSGSESAGGSESAPGYQELLYEATRVELAEGLVVQVASPEDLEHYSHVRRTGTAPEFRVTRNAQAEHEPAGPA